MSLSINLSVRKQRSPTSVEVKTRAGSFWIFLGFDFPFNYEVNLDNGCKPRGRSQWEGPDLYYKTEE